MRLPLTLPAPGAPFDVVGLGLNSIDLLAVVETYPAPNTKSPLLELARRPGGQAATAMTACARLGWGARYVGRVGSDEHGRLALESLEREGVDVSACRVVDGAPNQCAVIIVDRASGGRTIMWSRDPRLRMAPNDVPAEAVRSGRLLLVDCHDTLAAAAAARLAREAGRPTVIDVEKVRPHIATLLAEIDVIIAAQDFPAALTGKPLGAALRAIADEFHAPIVCATLGEEGCLAFAGGRELRTPGFTVDVVDTTGAGDAFRGGFLAGWLEAGPDARLEEVLRYANAVGALKCRALGAREALPTRVEVHALLGRARDL